MAEKDCSSSKNPSVFSLSFFSRTSVRSQDSPCPEEHEIPTQLPDDDDETCYSTSAAGSQQDLAQTEERGKWGGKLDFVFGCISYAVGLGNVWRFPYLCYENGGGAFLIPYFLCLIVAAIPMFYLEVAVGQYLSRGGIGTWKLIPMFKGIGIASLTVVTLSNIYYMVIVAWILFYLISSFTDVLPWKHCGNHWNTENCWEYNGTDPHNKSATPIVEFWERHVLGISSGIEEIGDMRKELALYLFVSWLIVYLVIWRGLHQSGKVVWVTAIFPYVCLFILLIRGLTLEGAKDGLLFYVKPVWSRLGEPKVWVAAGTQVFYTFGIGVGSVVTLGSYNKFHHNFFRDSAIVCVINPLTSLLAGTVIFSVLGHMAFLAKKTVGEVVASGPGLAFLVYPEVVIRMPASTVWSILFFVMLLCLGINSQFCPSEAIVAGVIDQWPNLVHKRKYITLFMVVFQFLLGLPMATQGGMYILQLMDQYAVTGITLLFIVFFQAFGLCWCYGVNRISDNIKEMLGRRPNIIFRFCWAFVIPAMCIGIFLFSVIKYEPPTYAKTYVYPWWGELLGWLMALSSMSMIPIYMIYYCITTPGSFKQRLYMGLHPQISSRGDRVEKEYTFSNTALQA